MMFAAACPAEAITAGKVLIALMMFPRIVFDRDDTLPLMTQVPPGITPDVEICTYALVNPTAAAASSQ